MRFREVTEAAAGILGVPGPRARKIARELQAARLVPVGGRGHGGLDLDLRAAATIVLGMLVSEGPSRAVDRVQRFGAMRCWRRAVVSVGENPEPAIVVGVPPTWATVHGLPAGHDVIDLFSALLADGVERRLGVGSHFAEVRAFTPTPLIEVDILPNLRDEISAASSMGTTLRACAPRATYVTAPSITTDSLQAMIAHAHERHEGERHVGTLSVERAATLATFAELGEMMRGA
jgi:hypothetical protein